jgi:hypothetical protein
MAACATASRTRVQAEATGVLGPAPGGLSSVMLAKPLQRS